MRYEEAVEAAAGALEQGEEANWVLARLTHEQADRVGMETWCEDVRTRARRKFSVSSGRLFRKVWKRRLDLEASGQEVPGFADLQREISPSSHDPEQVHIRQAEYYLRGATVEQKAKAITGLLSDPAVIEAAADPATPLGQAVTAVQSARFRAGDERVRQIRSGDPVSRYIDAQRALLELTRAMGDFARTVAELAPLLPELPPIEGDPHARTWAIQTARQGLAEATETVDQYLATGQPVADVDAVVRRLLATVPAAATTPKED